MLLIPHAGMAMEFRNECEQCLTQAIAQHSGKEMMVAIPLPLVSRSNDEQIGLLPGLQQFLSV